jgi:MFS family permease
VSSPRTPLRLPAVFAHRDFRRYWVGVVLSEIGSRGTIAAALYQVYQLTGSTLQVGLVGLAQAVALLVLSPLGGAIADRLDRRRLLQVVQGVQLVMSLALGVITLAGRVETWQILTAVLLTTAATTFDRPARQALITALVPRNQLIQAFALVNPSRELAILIGPALAGLLMAIGGPGLMYLVDAATFLVLIVALALIHVPPLQSETRGVPIWQSIVEGFRFIRMRPLILQLMALDLSAMLFASYRALLPALATDVLGVGPAGYGALAAAPSAGALLGAGLVIRLSGRTRTGHLLLGSTIGYGLCAIALAQSRWFAVALLAATGLGVFDAMGTAVRHTAVQLETPDEIRGRVSSLYQMASRGGPALGDLNTGWIASLLGPVTALTLGGMVPVVFAGTLWARGGRVRDYEPADD